MVRSLVINKVIYQVLNEAGDVNSGFQVDLHFSTTQPKYQLLTDLSSKPWNLLSTHLDYFSSYANFPPIEYVPKRNGTNIYDHNIQILKNKLDKIVKSARSQLNLFRPVISKAQFYKYSVDKY